MRSLIESPTVFDIGFADSTNSLSFRAFVDALIRGGKKYTTQISWETDVDSIQHSERIQRLSKDNCLFLQKEHRGARVLVELPGGYGWVVAAEKISVITAFDSKASERHEAFLREVKNEWPVSDTQQENIIQVGFWSVSPQGFGVKLNRKLEAQTWEDIQPNYPKSEPLSRLMQEFTPAHGGKMLLWHGIPGTG
ncbi:hypothetical protein LCGC14_2748270, partial [marine sediment metagenome]